MIETASSYLAPWSNFYMLSGTAAAGLTGLMFVVITLVTRSERVQNNPDGISTFSTPTVVHLGAALLVAAILSAPWRILIHPAALLGIAALCGVAYVSRVIARTRRLDDYEPDGEDWVWYSILPMLAYVVVLASAAALLWIPGAALFAMAVGVMMLIFIGIRNAWDIVTYIAIDLKR